MTSDGKSIGNNLEYKDTNCSVYVSNAIYIFAKMVSNQYGRENISHDVSITMSEIVNATSKLLLRYSDTEEVSEYVRSFSIEDSVVYICIDSRNMTNSGEAYYRIIQSIIKCIYDIDSTLYEDRVTIGDKMQYDTIFKFAIPLRNAETMLLLTSM